MLDRDRLKQARKSAGLTQQQLGELIGKTSDTVRGYEKGRIDLPVPALEALAAATGRDVRWFFQVSGSAAGVDVEERAAAVGSYDPDAPPMPPGLQGLIDMGVPMREDEVSALLGYADPMESSVGAQVAMRWSAGEWLNVLLEERRSGG